MARKTPYKAFDVSFFMTSSRMNLSSIEIDVVHLPLNFFIGAPTRIISYSVSLPMQYTLHIAVIPITKSVLSAIYTPFYAFKKP